MPKALHLHVKRSDRYTVILLLIPIMIFGLIIATYIFSVRSLGNPMLAEEIKTKDVAQDPNSQFILGTESAVDNSSPILIK